MTRIARPTMRPPGMRQPTTNPLLIVLLALAPTLAACQPQGGHHADAAPVIRPVRTITVEPVTFRMGGSATGTIEARADADLGFRIAGKLVERQVDVGSLVKAGDVLARLDDQDQRNALRTAEANLASAQADQMQARNEEARKRELLANGNAPQAQYDAALLAMRTADAKVVATQAALQSARDRVGYTELRADRDGVVTTIGAEPGQVVEAGQMVVRVAQPEEREAVFNVAETGIRAAPKDPVIEVSLAGAPDITAVGRVREISPQADPVTRTHTVRIALDNPPDALRLGATVVGRLKQPPAPVVELPGTALFEEAGRSFVWLVDPKAQTVRRQPVVIRPRDGARDTDGPVIVTEGLTRGDVVVTAGVHSLSEGQRVRFNQKIETAAAP
ncbi:MULTISPECIES: efflux RND transporter periplasmic adaptor subunit [Azospirillum]|uniref:Efflux RND transporter periplasmic adaptor subunit n=2 Tax=Azospirillum brasilense TaxID=192 RepID=A0ABU4PFR5_AZOBR|nr:MULTISPECIES: efflux RND transporter periplasmic adaptor subunit [Azospirillum]MDW7553212.1 efflux RND transporter periplasmic adaptor subunit [Azospirillum brasilense]MDW7628531.1 efflux RND transporter periplasmic adaptor subunit [Azospirillum brasilense]MDX5955374.1 efflux RND transporter periplasmic adaptor subunit [Azospirillum brasilense]TVZ54489.1 RND family efflux transporter MFP subunit [Azospirillum brasilense]TWB82022.1 RND family efflux transporter MFP subunit [Azospirillum bras